MSTLQQSPAGSFDAPDPARGGSARALPTGRWFAPPAALVGAVEAFWLFGGTDACATPISERALPDGAVDLIFALSQEKHASAYARGPLAVAHGLTFSSADSYLVARLRAGVAFRFFGEDADALLGQRIPLAELTRSGLASVGAICERSDSPLDLLRPFAGALAGLVEARGVLAGTELSRFFAALATRRQPVSRTRALASALAISERTLHRRMRAEIGISPKRYLRALRARHALGLLIRFGLRASVRVAAESGYVDQAHMCREFKALLGCAPGGCVRTPINAPLGISLEAFPADHSRSSC